MAYRSTQAALILLALIAVPFRANGQVASRGQARADTFTSAYVDGDGNLHIVTVAGKGITVKKGGYARAGESFREQTAFEEPVVSPDGTAVGAQAMFGNCCTSYDIPLQLVVHARGKTHRFEGGLAIFDWHFVDGGRRVAFSQSTVHFSCSVHWELRDIATERLLGEVDIPEACGQDPDPPAVKVPMWVNGGHSGIK